MTQAIEVPWNPTYRLIPSRFPPISLFERVASAEDFDAVYALQSLTNPRLRDEVGQIHLVAKEDRVFGEGSSPVMAAMCHINPEGSRFAEPTFGVYYAASSLEAAVAEVSYHRAAFMAATNQPAVDLDMRCYVTDVVAPLVDLRDQPEMHLPNSYAQSQAVARKLRDQGANGVLYRSVRSAGAECVAIFKPKALRVPVTQGAHVTLCWDGTSIHRWYKKSDVQDVPTA